MTPVQQAQILELVRKYGAECRLNGTGPEVTRAYAAVVAALGEAK